MGTRRLLRGGWDYYGRRDYCGETIEGGLLLTTRGDYCGGRGLLWVGGRRL